MLTITVAPYVSGLFLIIVAYVFYYLVTTYTDATAKMGSNVTLMTFAVIVLPLAIWLVIQYFLTSGGFYLKFDAMPPRFLLVVGPPVVLTITLVALSATQPFLNSIPMSSLHKIHTIRVFVEIVLYWIFLEGQIPELMTFEGRNFDILAGLTAPVISYMCFVRHGKRWSPKVALAWNFIALGLLFNIVGHAILSAPTPFQQFALEQPNVAVFHFPFVWLPAFIVPTVFCAHLIAIRRLLTGKL